MKRFDGQRIPRASRLFTTSAGIRRCAYLAVDAVTGQARAIVDERSDTFIDYSGNFFCHWLGDDELIWMSERDGWNHLWLYDAKTGQVRNAITQGEWVVQGVDARR